MIRPTMTSELPVKPLDSFPVVRSSDPAEVETALIGVYGARRLGLPGRRSELDVRANHWQSRAISLSYCSYGSQAQVEFPEAEFFRQLFPLCGGLAIRIDGKPHQVTAVETPVIRAGTSLFNDFCADYEQLVLRIDAAALVQKLAAMIGAVPRQPLEFESTTPSKCLVALRRLLDYFVDELDRMRSPFPPLMQTELEQTILTLFLCGNPSNYTARLHGAPKTVTSWQVRRAEEYIEAHWQEPLSIEALARVTSTSARSLFFHFKQSRGKSPMEFVKDVRLRHARRLLSEGQTSVTEAGFACGFGNLGHFAKDYFKRFGERPSETAKRAKAQLGCACTSDNCQIHAARR